jgi:hypothetical protein
VFDLCFLQPGFELGHMFSDYLFTEGASVRPIASTESIQENSHRERGVTIYSPTAP